VANDETGSQARVAELRIMDEILTQQITVEKEKK